MLIPKRIFALAKATGEAHRYALDHVQFSRDEDGLPWAAATDHHMLIGATWREDPPEDFPGDPGGCNPAASGPGFRALVPASRCREIAALNTSKSRYHPILQDVILDEHNVGDNLLHFAATDLSAWRRLAVKTPGAGVIFPTWKPLLFPEQPSTNRPDVIRVFPRILLRVLDTMVKVAGEDCSEEAFHLTVERRRTHDYEGSVIRAQLGEFTFGMLHGCMWPREDEDA